LEILEILEIVMSGKQGKKQGKRHEGLNEFIAGAETSAPAAVPQGGISQSVKSNPLTAAVLRDPRHEAYAQCVADGASYSEAYRRAGFADNPGNAYKPSTYPEVRARIRMLQNAAAEQRVFSIASRMEILDSMIHADPAELTRVTTVPCGECWTDQALAQAVGAALASRGTLEPPNTDAPRQGCPTCAGAGLQRVVITPTDELSPGGRALFKAARQYAKGEIVIELHDRLAAIAELNKMQPGALAASRSLNGNINVNSYIPAATSVDPDDLARLIASFDEAGGT
jgi:hypothetical protein